MIDMIRFPLRTKVKAWFGLDSFCLLMASNLNFKSIREIGILPRNRQFYIVFGWNKGQKDSIDSGSKNNQKFVQIPTARLKDRIAQLYKQFRLWTLQKSPCL